MIPKEFWFNQSESTCGLFARLAWRFPGSPATARDGRLIQMPHSCHHVETIRHPNASYVTTKLCGTSTCGCICFDTRGSIIKKRPIWKNSYFNISYRRCMPHSVSMVEGRPWSCMPKWQCMYICMGVSRRTYDGSRPQSVFVLACVRLWLCRPIRDAQSRPQTWHRNDFTFLLYVNVWWRLDSLPSHCLIPQGVAPILFVVS